MRDANVLMRHGSDIFLESGVPTQSPPPNEPVEVPLPIPNYCPGREQEPPEIPIDTPPKLPPPLQLRA